MKLFLILCTLVLSSAALAQGYVCAEGGGNPGKGAWADEVFGWMVEKGQKGPAVIIGAIALDAADLPDNREALFTKLGAKSCTSLIMNEKNADTQEIYDAITAASIVFIRGGAQERYVNWWKGTKTEQAIHAVFDKGGVIAGTSAGCAILGEVSYDSKVGSLKPTEALEDACHKHLTLTTDFLGLVPGVLFDTHFTERGRIGRLPVMLAHVRDVLHRDDIVGFGVDPRTALCVEPGGVATVRGEGSITLIEFTIATRSLIFEGQPPFIVGAVCSVLPAGVKLDMKTHEVTSPLSFAYVNLPGGRVFENQAIDGLGKETLTPPPVDEDKAPKPAPIKAPLEWWPCLPLSADMLSCAPNTWSHAAASISQQIRRVSMVYGPTAVWLGAGNKVSVADGRTLKVEGPQAGPGSSVVVLDTRSVTQTPTYWHDRLKTALVERQLDIMALDALVVKYQNDHPIEFAGLTPEQREAKSKELVAQFRLDALTVKWWVDEDATNKRLEADHAKVQPAIYQARLHLLPPGASLDLFTGEVPQFKYPHEVKPPKSVP